MGDNFSHFAILMKMLRKDRTQNLNRIHYVEDGNVKLALFGKYFVPLVYFLKVLKSVTDLEIYNRLTQGSGHINTFVTERVQIMLDDCRQSYPTLRTHDEFVNNFGSYFRNIDSALHKDLTDNQCADLLIKEYFLVGLETAEEKFDTLM